MSKKTEEPERASQEAWNAYCRGLTPGPDMDAAIPENPRKAALSTDLALAVTHAVVWHTAVELHDFDYDARYDPNYAGCVCDPEIKTDDHYFCQVEERTAGDYSGTGCGVTIQEAICRAILAEYHPDV